MVLPTFCCPSISVGHSLPLCRHVCCCFFYSKKKQNKVTSNSSSNKINMKKKRLWSRFFGVSTNKREARSELVHMRQYLLPGSWCLQHWFTEAALQTAHHKHNQEALWLRTLHSAVSEILQNVHRKWATWSQACSRSLGLLHCIRWSKKKPLTLTMTYTHKLTHKHWSRTHVSVRDILV